MTTTKKSRRYLWLLGGLILLAFLFYPYLQAEILTWQHGPAFKDGYQQTGLIAEVEYFKVIKHSTTTAEVFYVSKDHAGGNLLIFSYEENQWQLKRWSAVWSKTGSADGFMWPFYP